MRQILSERLRGPLLGVLLVVVVWAALEAPFAAGARTLVLRDVFSSHLPLKWFGALELAAGRIPAVNPGWALGQPFAGNPNALPYYPGNLLYLALPFWVAFNLHYFLHWLLAFFTMRRLARVLGQSPDAATLAGVAYAGSGYLFTCMTFYNLLAVAAWMPLVVAGLVRGGRRGALTAGGAGGMALLAGEPLSAALVAPLALYAAVGGGGVGEWRRRSGWRRGLPLVAAAGALAVALAAPQLVAAARVLPDSFRTAHGLPLEQVTTNPIDPRRLIELVLPLPWGSPAPPPYAHWATRISSWEPYVLSLHIGVVALALALAGARRARSWAAFALGALTAGWLLGLSASVTSTVTLGLFRYPQKLIFPFTLAAAVAAGAGVDAVLVRPRTARAIGLAAAALASLGLGLAAGRVRFAAWLGRSFGPDAAPDVLRTQAAVWIAGLFAGALLLAATAWAVSRRRTGLLPLLQLAGLVPLLGLIPSAPTELFRSPPRFAREVDPSQGVVSLTAVFPGWEPRPAYALQALGAVTRRRVDRELLEPGFAAVAGLSSPLAPDLEGLTQPLQVFLGANLARADWPTRIRWLRRLGVGALVRDGVGVIPGLEPIDEQTLAGVRAQLLRVPSPRGFLFRPRAVRFAPSPREAWLAVARGELADDEAVGSRPAAAIGEGSAHLVGATADRIELEVEGEGGVVGVLRAWQPLWRAELEDGTPLATQTLDLVLLGVEVPPGRHRVRLWIPRWPERAAGWLALAVALGAAIAWTRSPGEA